MAKQAAHKRLGEDPKGDEWQAKAQAAWDHAVGVAEQLDDPEQPAIMFYEAPPLPDFDADKPQHVKRPLLGRFLENREAGTVHDAHKATPQCGLDSIKNATFYHFVNEVPESLTPCQHCTATT